MSRLNVRPAPQKRLSKGGIRLILAAFALCTAAGCSMPRQRFSHSRYRQNFLITEDELKGLQFYLSTNVQVKMRAKKAEARKASESEPEGTVILFAAGTPGVVTQVGPDWLRVNFQDGREGAYFLANTAEPFDDFYYIAVRDPSTWEMTRVRDLETRTVVHEDTTYEVIYGTNAHLLVDGDMLQDLIDRRTRSRGRQVPREPKY